MCGIAGILKWTHDPARPAPWARREHGGTLDFSTLARMSSALAHRGPDGDGLYTDPRPSHTVALIHRRLAIIDLHDGLQPMSNEDGLVQVVFNGEIYNHAELRRQLQAAGHRFATDHSDTEVLVHGWEQWGTDLPSKLLGMFAFAVWDARDHRDTLFLARDRMGQKPLFYATLEDGIVFGSTINAVLQWPEVPRRMPREQLGLYFLLGYFPAPQTVWRDISAILPGGWLRLRKDVVDGGIYWEKTTQSDNPQPGPEQLRAELSRAVESQLIADVPIACFLSGGIDSSIIAALMQQAVRAKGGDPITTLSVGFTESGFDETRFAAAVAEKIGSRHQRLEVHANQDILPTLRMLMETSLGQPFADSSILPTYQLSTAVRQVAPVALSGDGADELFAGYDRYRAMLLLQRWRSLARLMPKSVPLGSLAKQERYRRLAAAARSAIPSQQYTRLVEIFPIDLAESLLGDSIMDWFPLPEEYGLPDDTSPLRLAMLRDQQEYLPGDVLWKVDSASMSAAQGNALEVRSPFLDHHVVELANALPDHLLLRGSQGKALLRDTFADLLPPAILSRTKKGFAVPIGQWFKTDLRNDLSDLLTARNSFVRTHLQPQPLDALLHEHFAGTRDHTHRLFALLTLELWAKQFSPTVEK